MAKATKVQEPRYVLELDEDEAKVLTALTGKLTGRESDNENRAASSRVFNALANVVPDYWPVYDALTVTSSGSLKFTK